MEFLLLLINLAGAALLLLWAVGMVRSGVEKINGGVMRRMVRRATAGRLRAASIGALVAMLLQSSTAVALLSTNFASSGVISVTQGLSLLLGADLGSAIVVQILSFDLSWLMPLLLLIGASLCLSGKRRVVFQAGRIVLGIALVLLSLRLMSEATVPMRESEFLQVAVTYLQSDLIASFLFGLMLTWMLHSSVASILLVALLVSQSVLPLMVGLAFMLGSNLGSGFIAVGLTRKQDASGRRVPLANLLCRACGAVAALLLLRLYDLPSSVVNSANPGSLVVLAHVLFNFVLVIVFLPLSNFMERLTGVLVVEPVAASDSEFSFNRNSVLDKSVLHLPTLALASATRELLRMSDIVALMLRPAMEYYDDYDAQRAGSLRDLEGEVNKSHDAIKLYLAELSDNKMSREDINQSVELSNFAISLEAAGDIVSKSMLDLASRKHDDKITFSDPGREELLKLHEQVLTNMQLALNVLVSGDRVSARQLVEEKERLREQERKSNVRHLKRLRTGEVDSIESSSIHVDTARALRQINSLFASVAYPILSQTGDLRQSRLTDEADYG